MATKLRESSHPFRLAVDIGGTFVDAVELDQRNGQIRLAKSPTTPNQPWEGVLGALDQLGTPLEQVDVFIHGTTLGLNAVLQRRGVRTGIITNEGLRDVFLIGRANVPDRSMYDFQWTQPDSLVRRRDTVGVPGRLDYLGRELEALDVAAVRDAARQLVANGVEAIAIVFLHSYRSDSHERLAAEAVREMLPDLQVSVSSEIVREYREYERTSTTVLDAYIGPLVKGYLDRLESEMRDRSFDGRFLVMRSGGGAMTADQARSAPMHTVLSGPAGGVIGAAHVGGVMGRDEILTFDAGGTSLDLCVIDRGQPVVKHEAPLERYPLLMPTYDIHTMGAGGGSIAAVESGLLKVGPQSAGADPGPIAYQRGGTEPTVTDAAIALGYVDPDTFLQGRMRLDDEASRRGIGERVGAPLGFDVGRAAVGVFEVLMARTAGKVREITVERGRDPKTFSLLVFGGAGPLLGPLLARELGIRELIVPIAPSVFSALGMLAAEVTDDRSRTALRTLESFSVEELEGQFLELEKRAADSLEAQGVPSETIACERTLDIRYLGQEHWLTLRAEPPVDIGRLTTSFHTEHELRYGHEIDSPLQILNVRARARALTNPVPFPPIESGDGDPSAAKIQERTAWCFATSRETTFRIFDRARLRAGDLIAGPSLIEEGTTTTLVMSDQQATVDVIGNLILTARQT
jgi:N-methylhydantoinase A/oxoprolinase/acetone carboxylase beta subunit